MVPLLSVEAGRAAPATDRFGQSSPVAAIDADAAVVEGETTVRVRPERESVLKRRHERSATKRQSPVRLSGVR
jgi:hypothetical protein